MYWRGRSRLSGAVNDALRCLGDTPDESIEVSKGVETQGGVCLPESPSPTVEICEMANRITVACRRFEQLKEGENGEELKGYL
jgi:hypothetical protein